MGLALVDAEPAPVAVVLADVDPAPVAVALADVDPAPVAVALAADDVRDYALNRDRAGVLRLALLSPHPLHSR